MAPTNASLDVPIFSGHGTAAARSVQVIQQAVRDASIPAGSVLLSACHEAFHQELSSLSIEELGHLNVNLADFYDKAALLSLSTDRYRHNPLISGCSLFLIQSLRYLAYVEDVRISTRPLQSSCDAPDRHFQQGLEVLGFSSGILPACIVATSTSTISYISRAVEVFRLAIWIGVRCHQFRIRELEAARLPKDCSLPWSLVFFGMSADSARGAIESFSKESASASLYITSVMSDNAVSISGLPHVLATFAEEFSAGPVLKTTVDTLYHAPIHYTSLRNQVLQDITSRGTSFPNCSDIVVPLRSTITGDLITKWDTKTPLVETVVDMLLTRPVQWTSVLKKFEETVPTGCSVRLLNFGPGSGLTRDLGNSFIPHTISVLDVSTVLSSHSERIQFRQEPIAIIGMAVNLPGAHDTKQLWELLENGLNTIAQIPSSRFNVSIYNSGHNPKRTMKACMGNFIDDVDQFDHKFFKISPREAQSMDPQQRVLLHAAYEALEDAGYVPNSSPSFRPEAFGCYIGAATQDYIANLRNEIDVYYSTGTLKSFLSGRISYAMKLGGPSIVIDTACSSSTVAIYQGARALMNGDCDAALVGGVNVISSPDMFLGLDRAHFLSPTGQCRPFDISADGYARGEGCAMFVLKRLSDAIRDGDNILGVIRAAEVNQSGEASSITHPHGPTQLSLFRRVLNSAGISPERVNVVEAHGTGTQAGDTTEVESIRRIFSCNRHPDNPLHITSIKANIGHLEAASGAAGLAKLLLMLRHRIVPPQISLHNLNHSIPPLEADHIVIDGSPTIWKPSHEGMPRVALLNNFGASGSNSALLIEEFVPRKVVEPDPEDMHYVFGLSARDRTTVEELRRRYLQWFDTLEGQKVRLTDLSYTSIARRQIYDFRIAIFAGNRQELREKLRTAVVYEGGLTTSQVVMFFSGQGSQYLGMGGALYSSCPVFRYHVDTCNAILRAESYAEVIPIIKPHCEQVNLNPTGQMESYQVALFVVGYALLRLWQFWGIRPVAVAGHSLGEYVALVAAGVLSIRDALLIVAHRARLMITKCPLQSTGMLVVNMGPDDIPAGEGITISCYNSVSNTVLSGTIDSLLALKQRLDSMPHCKTSLLDVPFAFHSSAMDPILEDLTTFCSRFHFNPPSIPIISNVLGRVVLPEEGPIFQASYPACHCREPVLFSQGVQSLLELRQITPSVFLEASPHPTIVPLLQPNPNCLILPSLRKGQPPWSTLMSTLARLYEVGVQMRWRELFSHLPSPTCISLPSYPWSKSKFWIPYTEEQAQSSMHLVTPLGISTTGHTLLRSWVQYPTTENGYTAQFETPIEDLADLIRGHEFGSLLLCPASVYLEQILTSATLCSLYMQFLDSAHPSLHSVEFLRPLVYEEGFPRPVTTTIAIDAKGGSFSIVSAVQGSSGVIEHATGHFRLQKVDYTHTKLVLALPRVSRQIACVTQSPEPEVLSKHTIYQVIFPRVIKYAQTYQTIQKLVIHPNGEECVGHVRLPPEHQLGRHGAIPVFLDTLLHALGFMANMKAGTQDAYICNKIGAVRILTDLVGYNSSYSVYCNISFIPQQDIMLGEVFAVVDSDPMQIVAHVKRAGFKRIRLRSLQKAVQGGNGSSDSESHSSASNFNILTPAPCDRDNFEDRISNLVLKTLSDASGIPFRNLDESSSLSDIGVDSLLTIELVSKLRLALPDIHIGHSMFLACTTIGDLIGMLKHPQSLRGDLFQSSSATEASTNSSPSTLVSEDKSVLPAPLVTNETSDLAIVLPAVLNTTLGEPQGDAMLDHLGLDSLTPIDAFTRCHVLCSFQTHVYPCTFKAHDGTSQEQSEATAHVEWSLSTASTGALRAPSVNNISNLGPIPVCIQASLNGKCPLFLVHDGSGLIHEYVQLPPLRRPTWAIPNPYIMSSQLWEDIPTMANAYAQSVFDTGATQVIIGGWSFGGIVAYEMTRYLREHGLNVKGVLLIDSPCPLNHVPLSKEIIQSAVELNHTSPEVRQLVVTQFYQNCRLLKQYCPNTVQAAGGCPPLVLLRSTLPYAPAGVLDMPPWLSSGDRLKLLVTEWENLTGRTVKALDIPGNHFQPFHPIYMPDVARQIQEGCDYFESLT
uniref:Polyketide synthase n=1 Tax=Volvariella volvacea TaxID=36659 RepID=F8QXP0_9AGAR|nr:polyketide synthase [Volvariella volvacea]